MDPALLSPSLRDEKLRPIYSRVSLFATAFFLGGFGIIIMATLNAHRLGRLKQDGLTLILCLIASMGVILTCMFFAEEAREVTRIASRGSGFLIWLLFSHLHGKAYRAMETFGTDHPPPYKAMLLSLALTIVLIAITYAIFSLLGGTLP